MNYKCDATKVLITNIEGIKAKAGPPSKRVTMLAGS
jgi:hypothetical protein